MIRLKIKHPLDGRLLEWAVSIPLILLGISMLLWNKIFHGSILRILVGSIGGIGTAVVFVAVGLFGIAALIANGSSLKIGPHIRSVTAIIRAVIWMSFTLSMAEVSIAQGFPSPMVYFFGSFTMAELYISYRAVLDVRSDL